MVYFSIIIVVYFSITIYNRQNTERQVLDLKNYAEYSNLEVVEVFEEYISGGKRNDERVILQDAIDYCIANKVDILLTSELSRIGRSTFEVLETVKTLIDNKINLYLQKEQFTLLDDNGKPSTFAPIMLATLATCASIERDNIQFRLSSGYKNYKANGGKVGRNRLNQCCRIEERRIQRDNPIIEERVFCSQCGKDFSAWN